MIVVVPYYNYEDSAVMRANHMTTLEKVNECGLRCLTVEVTGLKDRSRIPDTPDNWRVHRGAMSTLWHKEAAINYGYRWLKESGNWDGKMLWLDSGCYLSPEALMQTEAKLEYADFVQCFTHVHYLKQDGTVDYTRPGSVYQHLVPQERGRNDPGGAWATSEKFFLSGGLYPYMIVGGGDSVLSCMLLNGKDKPSVSGQSRWLYVHMLHWHRQMRKHGFSVDYADGALYHLWHIEDVQRRIRNRHDILAIAKYDPAKDVTMLNDFVTWRSTRERIKLHMIQNVENYLRSRTNAHFDKKRV